MMELRPNPLAVTLEAIDPASTAATLAPALPVTPH
jgi:hypothetical protein